MKIFLMLVLLGSFVQAASFDCYVEENFSNPQKIRITATDNQRMLVRSDWNYSFYLSTFTNGIVELEAFLPSVEMRIYSKGQIEKSSVTLTAWQREALLEFKCELAAK